MIGDIQRPQRSTTIMFSASWTNPSRVKKVRIGAGSFWRYAVMKVRLIANSQAAVDITITPCSASAKSRLTPPVTTPRWRWPHRLSRG